MSEERKHIRVYKQRELRFIEPGYKAAVKPIYDDIQTTFDSLDGVACKKGCAHCCKLYVEALPPEVAIMVDRVRNNFPAPLRQSILDRLKRNSVEEELRDKADYRQANLSCAFLDEEKGECMVYDVRPLTCRSFGSKNVSVCDLSQADDGKTTFRTVPQSLLMLTATSGLFWTGMHGAALSYWMGLPVSVVVSEDMLRTVVTMRESLDKAQRTGVPATLGVVEG